MQEGSSEHDGPVHDGPGEQGSCVVWTRRGNWVRIEPESDYR